MFEYFDTTALRGGCPLLTGVGVTKYAIFTSKISCKSSTCVLGNTAYTPSCLERADTNGSTKSPRHLPFMTRTRTVYRTGVSGDLLLVDVSDIYYSCFRALRWTTKNLKDAHGDVELYSKHKQRQASSTAIGTGDLRTTQRRAVLKNPPGELWYTQ